MPRHSSIQLHIGAFWSRLGAEVRQNSPWLLRVVLNSYLSVPLCITDHLGVHIVFHYFPFKSRHPTSCSSRLTLLTKFTSTDLRVLLSFLYEWLRIEIYCYIFTSNNPFKKILNDCVGQRFRLKKFKFVSSHFCW